MQKNIHICLTIFSPFAINESNSKVDMNLYTKTLHNNKCSPHAHYDKTEIGSHHTKLDQQM